MSPLNESQLEEIRNQRKQQIMIAALKVFAENGIKLTKISMIATAAGVSHGLVYHYFKSKEEVLYESLKWSIEDISFIEDINAMDLSPLEKIKHFTKFVLIESNSDIFRVILYLSKKTDLPGDMRLLLERTAEEYTNNFLPLVIEGQEKGEIIKREPQILLDTYLNVLTGILTLGDLEWWNDNTDEKVDILMRIIEAR